MGDPVDDPTWNPHLLWPEGVPDSTSFLNMLDEHDRGPATGADGGADGDAGACSGQGRASKREERIDDFGELEPCCKALAGNKPEGQTAKLKANREKQRRAQLNNRCGYIAHACIVARACHMRRGHHVHVLPLPGYCVLFNGDALDAAAPPRAPKQQCYSAAVLVWCRRIARKLYRYSSRERVSARTLAGHASAVPANLTAHAQQTSADVCRGLDALALLW